MPETLEQRLQDRYEKLVLGHFSPLHGVAAGLRALPDTNDSFAATQAAWRFWQNPRTPLPELADPLLQLAAQAVRSHGAHYALVVHDWSLLHYKHHPSKADRISLSNHHDPGYELQTALLLSDRDGAPIAPVYLALRAADGLHTTRFAAPRRPAKKLDRLGPILRYVAGLGWDKQAVHIIDREADSIAHYRLWARQGRLFLVRADDNRLVRYNRREVRLPAVVEQLRQAGAFRRHGEVDIRGQPGYPWVAEAAVTLHRPAKQKGGRVSKPGRALPVRLVVSEVRDAEGVVLARWLLLTNVPALVPAGVVALWYYWRWRIESYHKLLKSAGLQLEHWQQETAAALAKRLVVAAMACALVWKVGRSAHPQASELRRQLVRLSGRQMGWGVEATAPALLAGVWVLLQTLAVLEHFEPQTLLTQLRTVLTELERPPPRNDV